MKKAAFFDVDNTLVHGQSQQLFINYLRKSGGISLWGWMKLNLFFVIYKLGFESDMKKAFEQGLKYFIGKKVSDVDHVLNKFSLDVLSKRINQKALDRLIELRKEGYYIVLFSAAAEPIIRRIATMLQADDAISTLVEVNKTNDTYTGHIVGEPNYGANKSINAAKYAKKHDIDLPNSFAYSDHISDLPLLKLVGNGFLVPSLQKDTFNVQKVK